MSEIRQRYIGCVVGYIPGGYSPRWVNHVYLCLYCIVYLMCFISTFVLFYWSMILFF
jgi:hypothetical protein